MFDVNVNPYRQLKSIDLLIKQTELENKLAATSGLSNAGTIVDSLLQYKDQISEEVERRMYNGEINDEVIFIFEDYMRRKNEIEMNSVEQREELQAQLQFGDINESQYIMKLEELDKNTKQSLDNLNKMLK